MFGKKEKPKPKPRCFERELDELVKEEIEQLGDKYNSIPLIVFLSIQVLEKQKFKEGIFRISGNLTVVKTVQEKLDLLVVDIEGVKADLEKIGKTVEGQFAIATLIKKYLLTLPDPLIPFSLYDKFMDATLSRQEKMRVELLKKVSKELSMPRYQTLKALTQLFHKIQLESNVNQMTPENIGTAVGPSILRGGSMTTSKGLADIKFVSICLATMSKYWGCIFNDEDFPETKDVTEVKEVKETKETIEKPLEIKTESKTETPDSPTTPTKKNKPPLPKRNSAKFEKEKTEPTPKVPSTPTELKVPPKIESKPESKPAPKTPQKFATLPKGFKLDPEEFKKEEEKLMVKKPSFPVLPTKSSSSTDLKSPKIPTKSKESDVTPQPDKSPRERGPPPKPLVYQLDFNEKNFKEMCAENERLIKEIIELKNENIQQKITIDSLHNELLKTKNKQAPIQVKEDNILKKMVNNVMNMNNNQPQPQEEFPYD